MRFNKKHQDRTRDGLSYAVFGAPNLPLFMVKPIISRYLNEKKQNKGVIQKLQSSSHFALLTIANNTMTQWIQPGISFERFLLKSTELGLAHSYLNQPVEVQEIVDEMARALKLRHYPALLLRMGDGNTQPYSKRKDVRDVLMNG